MITQELDNKYFLSGNWTICGGLELVDLLSTTLNKMESGHHNKLYVDCAKIDSIDVDGLQLLHVWIECARIRGLEVKLDHLPLYMHKTIQHLERDNA